MILWLLVSLSDHAPIKLDLMCIYICFLLSISNLEVVNMPYLFAMALFAMAASNNNLVSSAILLGQAETEHNYALYLIKDKPVVTKLPETRIRGKFMPYRMMC